MRAPVTEPRLRAFMRALGEEARAEGRVYLTGGATAVLLDWRASTVDVDLKIIPDDDRVLRAIPALKERLQINIELASPDDFIPELPGWRERSRFIAREGALSFYHYDFYAQCLSKLERAHRKDLLDAEQMVSGGLVDVRRLRELFAAIEPNLYRYPAIDPAAFRKAVEAFAAR
jgi:hypothetical protein